MASGRRDYWIALDDGKRPYSQYQTPVFAYGFTDIIAGGSSDIPVYTVPDGYLISISSIVVSCERAGINVARIKVSDTIIAFSYFDTNFVFPASADGIIKIDPAGTLKINCTNNDSVANFFFVNMTGYLTDIYS